MKYTKQNNNIEPLELCGDDGAVIHRINVLTDYFAMKTRLESALGDIQKAQKSGNAEDIGKAVCVMLTTVYGDENGAKLLEYFEGNYIELINVVYQHLQQEVYPKLRDMFKKRKKMVRKGLTPFR